MESMGMVERVARAVESVEIYSRFNDWTSDRVDGFPIEIYVHDGAADIIVTHRFPGRRDECSVRRAEVERIARARAAIEAMREPTEEMEINGTNARMNTGLSTYNETPAMWRAMIDAALKEEGEED